MEAPKPIKCRLQINGMEELKSKLNKVEKLTAELSKAIEEVDSAVISYEIIEVQD